MKKAFCFSINFFLLVTGFCQTTTEKGWPSSERYSFISECAKTAGKTMSADSARIYCYCMQEKVETKFPTVAEAGKLTREDMMTKEWQDEVKKCFSGITWSTAFRSKFMSECIGEATKSIGEQRAKTYCECMVFKIETKFPIESDADKISEADLGTPEWKKIIADCLKF